MSLNHITYYDSVLYFFTEPYIGSIAEEMLKIIDLDAPLSEPFSDNKSWSSFLGANGWVISPYIKISKGIHPWYWAAKRNRHDLIERFFIDKDGKIIKSIFGYIAENISVNKYVRFYEAVKCYLANHFTPCVMVLISLFEGCIRECPIPMWRYKITNFYKEAVSNELVAKDKLNAKFTGQIMLKNNLHSMYLPSLDSFITRLFCNPDHKFENGNEPPYLNRNWLMHGMMKRNVTKRECIQMFNALFTLLYATTYLVQNSPYDN